MVRRVGLSVEREAVTLGEEGRLVWVQLSDLRRGVEHSRDTALTEYLGRRRTRLVTEAVDALEALSNQDLDDPAKVGKAVSFPELDEPVTARGYRLLAHIGRIPETVRDELVRSFKSLPKMVQASQAELDKVEGIGDARAAHLRRYFDRLLITAAAWEPDLS
jgi:diadenylate cyclase